MWFWLNADFISCCLFWKHFPLKACYKYEWWWCLYENICEVCFEVANLMLHRGYSMLRSFFSSCMQLMSNRYCLLEILFFAQSSESGFVLKLMMSSCSSSRMMIFVCGYEYLQEQAGWSSYFYNIKPNIQKLILTYPSVQHVFKSDISHNKLTTRYYAHIKLAVSLLPLNHLKGWEKCLKGKVIAISILQHKLMARCGWCQGQKS